MESTVGMRWWCRGFGSAWGQKRPLVVSSSCCPLRCWTPTWFHRTAVLEFLRSCSWRTLVSRVWDDCKQAKKKDVWERGVNWESISSTMSPGWTWPTVLLSGLTLQPHLCQLNLEEKAGRGCACVCEHPTYSSSIDHLCNNTSELNNTTKLWKMYVDYIIFSLTDLYRSCWHFIDSNQPAFVLTGCWVGSGFLYVQKWHSSILLQMSAQGGLIGISTLWLLC